MLFISLLCWWHSTLPLILSWWSDDSCSHLSMSSGHFLLDEGPSPSTETCQNRTACGSIKPSFHHNFTFQLGSSTITSSKSANNLIVIIDDQLTFQTILLKLPGPAKFLYSTSRRSGPFFQNMHHNSLFRLLFCPGWTIAMFSWQVFQPVLSNLYS